MKSEKQVVKLVWLLVMAGWNRREISELFETMRYVSFSEVESLFLHIKTMQNQSLELFNAQLEGEGRPAVGDYSSEIADKIGSLLRVEAGLTVSEAIYRMTVELRRLDKFRGADLPGFSKQSLSSWVDRAATLFSPSELLFVATRIRNKVVHEVELDWGLRKK